MGRGRALGLYLDCNMDVGLYRRKFCNLVSWFFRKKTTRKLDGYVMQRYAIFDLDETITTRSTWGRFVSEAVVGNPIKLVGLWLQAGVAQLIYKFGRAERIFVKRGMLRWSLSGQPRDRLEVLANRFAEKEADVGVRPGALRQIEKHQLAGDRVVIASAGADIIVNAIAARLKIEHVVCTELAWENGLCKRNFGSSNCYADGKLKMLKKCLETFDDFRREAAHITMYSDSHSDLPCFEYADVGIAVNADMKLRRAAKVYGLATVDWSKLE